MEDVTPSNNRFDQCSAWNWGKKAGQNINYWTFADYTSSLRLHPRDSRHGQADSLFPHTHSRGNHFIRSYDSLTLFFLQFNQIQSEKIFYCYSLKIFDRHYTSGLNIEFLLMFLLELKLTWNTRSPQQYLSNDIRKHDLVEEEEEEGPNDPGSQNVKVLGLN